MGAKLGYFLYIVFGAFFLFLGVWLVVDVISIKNVFVLTILGGVGLFLMGIGFKFLFENIRKSIKERKVLKDGMVGTGMVLSVSNSAAYSVNGELTAFYFVTIRFINQMGEKCDYELANHYDTYQVAYMIKKGKLNIIMKDDVCVIDEDLTEAYNLDKNVAKKTAKRFLVPSGLEKVENKMSNMVLDNKEKIYTVAYYNEVIKSVILAVCIFVAFFPFLFVFGPLFMVLYGGVIYAIINEVKRKRKIIDDAIEKEKNRKKRNK